MIHLAVLGHRTVLGHDIFLEISGLYTRNIGYGVNVGEVWCFYFSIQRNCWVIMGYLLLYI